MVTITINLENGIEAADACREVARMIENGYTSGMIGCSGDTFEIEGDIFSDDEDYPDVKQTESGKTEVRITAVENHHYPFRFYGDKVNTSHFRLTELFGEDNGNGNKDWVLLFEVSGKHGSYEEFGVYLYNIKREIQEDVNIYWNIGSNKTFNSSTAREVIDMLIRGELENDEYKIFEVKKK